MQVGLMVDELDDILRRLKRLEERTPQYRQGVITDAAAMSIALGGSDVSYDGVRALGGASLHDDDVVGALQFGNDMLVLGPIAVGPQGVRFFRCGVSTATYAASVDSAPVVVTHGLTDARGDPLTPSVILCTAGNSGHYICTPASSSTTFTAVASTRTAATGPIGFYWAVFA